MEDTNEGGTVEVLEQQDPAPDAVIELRHTGEGIDVAVHAVDNQMNPAIHFANWLGRNLQPLLALAREDYNHKVDQAKEARRKAATTLLTPSTPRLVGPDGGPLQ